jgi:hypothetical protein
MFKSHVLRYVMIIYIQYKSKEKHFFTFYNQKKKNLQAALLVQSQDNYFIQIIDIPTDI